jgi:hypothetical protein
MTYKTAKLAPQRHHLDKRAATIVQAAADTDGDDLLTTREVANWLQCSDQFLEIGRHKGYGPPFQKISERMIRYKRRDVIAWLEERRHKCTSEYSEVRP